MTRNKKYSSLGQPVDPTNPYITKLRKIKKIVFHCTATPSGRKCDAKDIDEMHRRRWGANSGCGYHYVITVDGNVEKGRWSDSNGSHAGPDKKKGRPSSNPETIAVVYAGGLDDKLKALSEGMSEIQKIAASKLLNALAKGYGLETKDIIGHGEITMVNKACPCTNMNSLRARVDNVNN